MDAPTIKPEDLALIADLEAQLAVAVGDDRRPLRRKLRQARRGGGVPMARLRSSAGKRRASVRIEGESDEAATERLQIGLRAASCKPAVIAVASGFAFPVNYPVETLMAKYEARMKEPARFYRFIKPVAASPSLVVLS